MARPAYPAVSAAIMIKLNNSRFLCGRSRGQFSGHHFYPEDEGATNKLGQHQGGLHGPGRAE